MRPPSLPSIPSIPPLPSNWRELVRPMAMQAGFFASLGVGAMMIRRLSAVHVHPMVLEHAPAVVRRFPAMAITLTPLLELGDEDAFLRLLGMLTTIEGLDRDGGPAAQWQISRLSTKAIAVVNNMCDKAQRARSDAMFHAVLTCREEVVNQLEVHLQNLLHNHLLTRASAP